MKDFRSYLRPRPGYSDVQSLWLLTYVIAIFIFDLDFDQQRDEADEALLQESYQVQETSSGFNTWVWA